MNQIFKELSYIYVKTGSFCNQISFHHCELIKKCDNNLFTWI